MKRKAVEMKRVQDAGTRASKASAALGLLSSRALSSGTLGMM